MKKILFVMLLVFVCSGPAQASGLDTFLDNININASADRDGFAVQLGSYFGISRAEVEVVINSVGDSADAFLVFQLGRMSGVPVRQVLNDYQATRGQGWGALAKRVGIKPGSSEFHQLKQGNFAFHMPRDSQGGSGKGNGKGQGNGKGKGNGKDKKKKK